MNQIACKRFIVFIIILFTAFSFVSARFDINEEEIKMVRKLLDLATNELRFADAVVLQKKLDNLLNIDTKLDIKASEMAQYAFYSWKKDYESFRELEKENIEISKNVILEIMFQLASKGHRLIGFQMFMNQFPFHPLFGLFNNWNNPGLSSYFQSNEMRLFEVNEWYSIVGVLTDFTYFNSPIPHHTIYVGKGNYELNQKILSNPTLYAKDIVMRIVNNKDKDLIDYFKFINLIQSLFSNEKIEILCQNVRL